MSKLYSLLTTLITINLISTSSSDKILFFFGGGSYSHKHSAWPVATALAERGHDVTFLSSFQKSPSPNPKLRDLHSPTLQKLMSQSYDVDRFQERQLGRHLSILTTYAPTTLKICETILLNSSGDPILQDIIHNQNFDLVVINAIFGECGFILGHHYNAKMIVYDASIMLSWFYDVYGIAQESAWVPDISQKFETVPLSFLDRLQNTFWSNYYWTWNRHKLIYPGLDAIMAKAFPNRPKDSPSFLEIEKNASLLFINSHYSFDFALSLPPCAIQIGGINAFLPENDIPEKYQKFMDRAGNRGVVLISFGSTVNLEKVSSDYFNIFFQLIQKHRNVHFLLKWNGPIPSGFERLNNLLASDWLPQREILRHPKVAGFITHGGLNSIQEATYYGVPMIVLPLFSDQDYNAYRIEAQQVGVRLEISTLTFSTMDKALSDILGDSRYKTNMEMKSKLFRDRPENPLQTAVYWAEWVLRNEDFSSLKPMNSHLNWSERRLIDVFLFFSWGLILGCIFITVLFYKLCKMLLKKGHSRLDVIKKQS